MTIVALEANGATLTLRTQSGMVKTTSAYVQTEDILSSAAFSGIFATSTCWGSPGTKVFLPAKKCF